MSGKLSLRERLRSPRQLVIAGAVILLTLYLLRSCIPGLQGGLPSQVLDLLQTRYVVCIEDVPIWPGEPRQPECGQVEPRIVGQGVVPVALRGTGVTKALCFRVTVTNPYWSTQGQTRHEIVRQSRTASKVAVLQAGSWTVPPDEEITDRQRWIDFACPGPYDAPAGATGD
jgi:hypothetical protein